MDERSFAEMVEYVRKHYIDDNAARWEDPSRQLQDLYESMDGSGRGFLLSGLIERSEDSKLEWEALSLIAQKALRSGEMISQDLAEWIADALAGDRRRPTTGAQSKSYRNFLFCLAVRHLQNEFGLTPTSNPTSDAHSACEVVSEAAVYSLKTVEAAWAKRGPFFRS